MDAFETCLNETSTKSAPWHIIPADHKWVAQAMVAKVITSTIEGLDMNYPEVPPEKHKQIEAAKKALEEG